MTEAKSPDAGKKINPLPSIERAKRVMEAMQGLSLKKETVNFLKGLPPMIMQNGLGQTIAFIKSKSKDNKDYERVLNVFNKLFESQDLIKDKILNAQPKKYIHMQKEAIEYAGWMKKFALAFNVESKEEKKDDTPAS
jgi:CRISPR-associated protein Cmr5